MMVFPRAEGLLFVYKYLDAEPGTGNICEEVLMLMHWRGLNTRQSPTAWEWRPLTISELNVLENAVEQRLRFPWSLHRGI